ncbi:MAG: hypothetical protein ABI591_34055 [Kofleriaceae bacterium]
MTFTYLLKGALVEYGVGLANYLPNVVMFQFNPESITRTLEIPPRPSGASLREVNQAGEIPIEKISLMAHFSAQEDLARENPITLGVGIGPQLAALDKLVRPTGPISGLINKAVDKVGSLITGKSSETTQQIPRESYPRVLFVWGATRVLPVTIDSLSVVEKQYDALLNPTLAEVTITMTAIMPDPCSDDPIAKGAFTYSQYARDALALINQSNSTLQILDIIHF